MILTALNGNLRWQLIKDAARSTSNITALVIMILFCSSYFGLVFDELGTTGCAKRGCAHSALGGES